jgi:hypothetical protein
MTANCACGQLSISVHAQPVLHGVCHCTNCKRRTGSAFGISAYFDKSAVKEKVGESSVYAFHHHELNHDQARHFCPKCGTTLYWFVSNMPDKIGIAGGCFAPESLGAPGASYRDNKKESWVSLPNNWLTHTE